MKSNRNVDCQGANEYGQANDYNGGDATAATGSGYHTCILKSNGNVDCYGGDAYGDTNDYNGGDATAVEAGYEHTCILKSNGNVDCYGRNNLGQADDYNGGDATAVSTDGDHTCILKSNGNVDCRGNNVYGQAADYNGGDAIAVSAGEYHTCVLKSNRNVDCYGWNSWGQSSDYSGGDAVAVTANYQHTCVVQTSGNVYCYGLNGYGQANGYAGGDAATIDAGSHHTCILKSNGNVHCWGYNDWGQSLDYGLPSAPGGFTAATGPSVGQITLTWQAPSDNAGYAVTGYRVYRGTTSGSLSLVTSGGCSNLGNVLTCTDSSLSNGATYYYKVSAVNAVGEGWQSSEASATTHNVPSAPQSLSATAGTNQIALNWAAPSSNGGLAVTGYKVYRGTTSGGETLVTTGGCSNLGNVLSCTDSSLGNGATRYYKVSATNAAGEGAQSNEASATTFNVPSAPQDLSAAAGPGAGKITLTWQAPSSNGGLTVTSYKVYWGTSSGAEVYYTTIGNVLTWTHSGLGDGVTRYYKVSSVNSIGEGGQSNEASATTTIYSPTPPQNLQTSSSVAQTTLTWQAPANIHGSPVTSYKVYRGASSGSETILATVGTVLSYIDNSCTMGNICYYQVTAVNGAGESSPSNEAFAPGTAPPPACPAGTMGATSPACAPNPCPADLTSPPAAGQLAVVCGQGVNNPCPQGVDQNTVAACGAGPACPSGIVDTPAPGQLAVVCGQPVTDPCPTPIGNPGPNQLAAVCGQSVPNPCPQGANPGTVSACGAGPVCPTGATSPPAPGQLLVMCGTGIPNPIPADADADNVPDAQEETLCGQENPNLLSDGQCSGSDYTPPTYTDMVSDVIWLATGTRP